MKPLYSNIVADDFLRLAKEKNMELDFKVINNHHEFNRLQKQINEGTAQYPLVYFQTRYFLYVKNRIISNYNVLNAENNVTPCDYDYVNTLPMDIIPTVSILCTDISQLSEIEEFILSVYSNGHSLNTDHPLMQDNKIPFEIRIDTNKKISREQFDAADNHIYETYIPLIGYNCPSFTETYSSARLELDESANHDVIERLSALEDIKALFIEKNEASDCDKTNAIDTAWKALDSLIRCNDGIASYHELWEVITSNGNCHPDKAIEIITAKREKAAKEEARRQKKIADEKKKEDERIQHIETIFKKTGDKVVNRFTDAVVEELKNKLQPEFDIPIYGGSTYAEWYRLEGIGKLTFPNILVIDKMNYTFAIKEYLNTTADGDLVTHRYSQEAFPIEYGISIVIRMADDKQLRSIEKKLWELYKNEVQITVPDPVFENELCPIKLLIDSDDSTSEEEIESKQYGKHTKLIISFKMFPNVYYPVDYYFNDVKNNQKLQLRLLQQAEFLLICNARLEDAVESINGAYKNLFKRNEKNTLKGFFANASDTLLDSVIYSREYLQLKKCFQNGTPFERTLFDSALKKITDYYPSLYDKTMAGWSPERLHEDINRYNEFFSKKWNTICNNLAIGACPSMFLQLGMSDDDNKPTETIRKGLVFYTKKMANDPYCMLADAKEEYAEQIHIAQEEARRAAEEARQAAEEARLARREREQYNDYSESYSNSSGGGFLSGLIDQSIEKSNMKRNAGKRGKRDLIGRAGCAKSQGGSCCDCRIRFGCSRYSF